MPSGSGRGNDIRLFLMVSSKNAADNTAETAAAISRAGNPTLTKNMAAMKNSPAAQNMLPVALV